eukprot:GHVU01037389.1.p1 GENE.GHVU01037389.1~~GHVU01037389.1.p1  ORF type:complete len:268 (+),score=36.77 GHVU01037389.1:362-1165(+)
MTLRKAHRQSVASGITIFGTMFRHAGESLVIRIFSLLHSVIEIICAAPCWSINSAAVGAEARASTTPELQPPTMRQELLHDCPTLSGGCAGWRANIDAEKLMPFTVHELPPPVFTLNKPAMRTLTVNLTAQEASINIFKLTQKSGFNMTALLSFLPGPATDLSQLPFKIFTQADDEGASPMWTFNGEFPGPLLRVYVGDRIRVEFKNSLPAGVRTTFHMFGLEHAALDDGTSLTQPLFLLFLLLFSSSSLSSFHHVLLLLPVAVSRA